MKKIVLALIFVCCSVYAKEKIVVFHAGSLSVPFKAVEKEFESKYPNYDVLFESAGSRVAARKVSELKKSADIVASADYTVIDNLLIDTKNAKYNIHFVKNEMVLAYTQHSKFRDEINSNNWYEIFLRDGVKVGHSDPNSDPCGYRSMLVTQLADIYYKKDIFSKVFGYTNNKYTITKDVRSNVVVRPKETDLLGLLEVGAMDYLYIYKSVAQQHNLKYIELPEAINLSSNKYEKDYEKAAFDITGKKPGEFITKRGKAMVYSVTIPYNENSPQNPAGAKAFLEFLLSDEGLAIMEKNGQPALKPLVVTGDISFLPQSIKNKI